MPWILLLPRSFFPALMQRCHIALLSGTGSAQTPGLSYPKSPAGVAYCEGMGTGGVCGCGEYVGEKCCKPKQLSDSLEGPYTILRSKDGCPRNQYVQYSLNGAKIEALNGYSQCSNGKCGKIKKPKKLPNFVKCGVAAFGTPCCKGACHSGGVLVHRSTACSRCTPAA